MLTSALFGAKNFGFFKIYDVSACPHGQEGMDGGLSQCGQGGGGHFFAILCRSIFQTAPFKTPTVRSRQTPLPLDCGHLLWTAPN